MTSFAIYEIFGFILSLPLSYAMAYLVKKYSEKSYKKEVDRLVAAVWNGKDEDELNAWLKVHLLFQDKKAPRKKKYIQSRISALDKYSIKSGGFIDENGEYIESNSLKSSNS